MKLNLLYPHSEALGYGRYGTKLAEAIAASGVTVYDSLPGPKEGMQHLQATSAAAHLYPKDSGEAPRCNVVAWVSVPSHARGWWKGQTPIVSTMWEAYRIPESFVETIHEFETVIVPSQQNVELFSDYHKNVKLVLLGIDPTEWFHVERTPPGMFFDFLIGGSGARKGTDLAYKAFCALWGEDKSWGDGPIPRLIMKNPKGEEFEHDRVQIIGGRLDAADERALYASSHCYLQPSRGEGFGLQPLQALAQGMPTILTDAHGHASFAHLGYGLSTTPSPSAYFIYGDAGEWWEPDFDELCDYMRYVYDHYDEACTKARFASRVIANTMTWRHTADAFLDAIGRDRLTDYEGPDEWYIPTQKLYSTVLLRHHITEIGGIKRIFHQGEETWEPADVKRILWEANLLDPVCVTADSGLLPQQVEALGKYQARNAYCPTCSQRLNTQPTRTDDYLAGATP